MKTSRRVMLKALALLAASALLATTRPALAAKHALGLTLQPIPVSPNVSGAVMSDPVQICGTTPPVLLQAADSRLDLVARSGVGGFVQQDPIGKKVGAPGFDATSRLLVRKGSMDKGVDPKKVSFVEASIPQLPDVLKGDSVDAAATAEPFATRIAQSRIGVAVPAFAEGLQEGFASVLHGATRRWPTSARSRRAAESAAAGTPRGAAVAGRPGRASSWPSGSASASLWWSPGRPSAPEIPPSVPFHPPVFC